jgi:F420-dependent methylenetetrahydromethanopterin dehydrogenase
LPVTRGRWINLKHSSQVIDLPEVIIKMAVKVKDKSFSNPFAVKNFQGKFFFKIGVG